MANKPKLFVLSVLVALAFLTLQAPSSQASDRMLISVVQPDGAKVARVVSLGQPLSKLREDLVGRSANILPDDKFLVPDMGELSPRDEGDVKVSQALAGNILSFKPRSSSSGAPSPLPYIDTASDESKKIRGVIESSLIRQVLPPITAGGVINTKSQAPMRPRPQKASASLEIKGRPARENSLTKEHILKKIIPGRDGRVQVTKTHVWPNSVHGLVSSIFCCEKCGKEFLGLGSGTLIAPNLVLTAAHNLYEKEKYCDEPTHNKVFGVAKKVKFYPAIHGDQTVFGEQIVREFYYPPEFQDSKHDEEDYGLMILKNPVGEMTGYFGLGVLPPEHIKKLTLNVTGYPYDKCKGYQYEMWGMAGSPKTIDQNLIAYEIDTYSGQSGSGVWYQEGDDYLVLGVHVSYSPALNHNQATLLTEARYGTIRKWVAESIRKLIRDKSARGMLSSAAPIDFRGKMIGDDGVRILCEEYAHCLHSLDLSQNGVTDKGAEVLAANTTLVTLDLSGNEIGVEGAKALAANKTLTSLDLRYNEVGDEEANKALAANKTLKSLDLRSNRIGDEGAKALAANKTLTSLDLRYNEVGDDGAKALATNKILKSLDLRSNRIGDEGTKALATNKTLVTLDLRGNRIGDDGAKALSANKTLTLLNLRFNKVTTEPIPQPDWWELFNQYGGGVMYRYKPGVPENDPKAIKWLTYAANHGHKGAIGYLKEMKKLPDLKNYEYPTLITNGYEAIYQRFLNGALIYTDPDGNKITLPIRDLSDPLEGTFDLSKCGNMGRNLSISTGYRKGKKQENKDKVEIWIAPRFLIEKELNTTAAHFKKIIDFNWKQEASVGIFWTWSGYGDNMNLYDYLTDRNMDELSGMYLYRIWIDQECDRDDWYKDIGDLLPYEVSGGFWWDELECGWDDFYFRL